MSGMSHSIASAATTVAMQITAYGGHGTSTTIQPRAAMEHPTATGLKYV